MTIYQVICNFKFRLFYNLQANGWCCYKYSYIKSTSLLLTYQGIVGIRKGLVIPWKKKNTESCFDVTMGSFDGAKICELVGIHILSLLSNKLDKQSTGLYRDDGLVLLRNTFKPKTDRIRKDIIEIFKNAGFNIEIKTNLYLVDF